MFDATLPSEPEPAAYDAVSSTSDRNLQRAAGECKVVVKGSAGENSIADLYQRSPVRVLFPRMGGGSIEEIVLVNTAGGVAGGDRLNYDIRTEAGSSLAVTSQAAEKVYRALGEPARISTKLRISAGATLSWLPQETILFDRARLTRTTEIDLVSGSECLALEWLVLGRAAHLEEVRAGQITDRWRVRKEGCLIWADSFRVTDDIFPHLSRSALLDGCRAIATLLYYGPAIPDFLKFCRNLASGPCRSGVTSVADLTIVRFAAPSASDLRAALRNFLQELSRHCRQGSFRAPKMWSC